MSEWCGWPVVEESAGWEAVQLVLTDADLSRMLGLSAREDLRRFLMAHGLSEATSPAHVRSGEHDPGFDREAARAAAQRIRAMRQGVTLGGLSIKDLINEGRR